MTHRYSPRSFSLSFVVGAGLLMLTGCEDFSRPVRAETGLAARAQACVATNALAAAWRPPAAAHGSETSPAKPGREAVRTEELGADASSGPPAADAPLPVADMRIKRLVLARGVEAREPVGAADSFELDEARRIYAFVEVNNLDQVESEIFVTFEPASGPARGHVRLPVGASPRWRTWAYTRGVRQAGPWTAVVRNAAGVILARKTFDVKAAGSAPGVAESRAPVEAAAKAIERGGQQPSGVAAAPGGATPHG